jgi:DUF2950 family protein
MRNMTHGIRRNALRAGAIVACAVAAISAGCGRTPTYRTFGTPEQAVGALIDAVKSGKLEQVMGIFGSDGQALVDSSDPALARRNQQVFTAAVAEKWHLEADGPDKRTLVIGNEEWPFPIPIVKDANGWRFDTDAGKEEVLARRIGRNELAAIRACQTYVGAQHLYSLGSHDGRPAGVYAASFRSDPGKQNGLYWPTAHGERPSPLGDLVATAAAEGRPIEGSGSGPAPFHGYYFRILTGQGPAARGGARSYIVDGAMSGGFALVAWPAQYDVTGVMTFIINADGTVSEKDLGRDTDKTARAMTVYDPDPSWTAVQ